MYMKWPDLASRAGPVRDSEKGDEVARRRRHYRDLDQPGGFVQLGRLFVAAVILLVLSVAGLAYYGSTLTPPRHEVEKVLPDDRFPR